MDLFYTIFFYTLSFLSVYVQIFFLVTYIEKRKKIIKYPDILELNYYPTVTITIPCYNEEKTLSKTVESLLELDYPKDKLKIFLVDDGSKDNTWNVIKSFESHPNIEIFHKENGGKHTALNLALEHTTSEFVGCLDSDSLVHPQSLKRVLKMFEEDPKNMAIAPSIIVYQPKNFVQSAQKIEYDMSVYVKKMLGFSGGIHVTPGPFSIFRKRVFDELGPYRKAHNTEDQEIALRMQEHGYKIDHCPGAFVYTFTPNSITKLYKQRLRWIYGFIKNLIDYRRLLFKKKYGTVALFTLPSGMISVLGVLFLFFYVVSSIIKFILQKIIKIQTVGFSGYEGFHFDWFYINTKPVLFFSLILYILIIVSIMIGRRLTEEKNTFSLRVLYFFILYSTIGPFWILKAIYNAVLSRESSWTSERKASKK